jgi:hypothetical protein
MVYTTCAALFPKRRRNPQLLENSMLKITLSPEAREKIKALLAEDDDYDEPLLRIREVKVGGG